MNRFLPSSSTCTNAHEWYTGSLPQYPFFFAKVLGYSAAQFGVIASVYGLALAAFPILLGRLSEIFPKKLLIILGSLLYSALNMGMLFLPQYALLIGAAALTGIGNALLIPALSTIYLGATTEQNRSQVMGIRGTAISLGTLLGPLAQALASPRIAPQMTFAIAVALSLVITLLACVVLKRSL
jgi:MFS family permease